MMKITKTKCETCHGKGLIELKEPELCSKCKNVNNTLCHCCQQRGGAIIIKECNLCDGYGEIYTSVTSKKQVFLYARTNYTFV